LHGDAIVENASQAVETFKKSDIDILIINNFAIVKAEVDLFTLAKRFNH